MANIPITFPDSSVLEGDNPIVFIGANGAGKTRFGAHLAELTAGSTRIPALRSLNLEPTLRASTLSQASNESDNKIGRYRTQESHIQADEINDLLAEFKAEKNDVAVDFLDRSTAAVAGAETPKPPPTKLDRLLTIWAKAFPGRILDFSTYEPKVRSDVTGTAAQYNPNTMSDGERVAIYLIARVLRAPAGVVIVDEPEVHLHSLLARSFWDILQGERPDCRFVFVTHDLPFALSRRGAQIGIVKSNSVAEMVDISAGMPPSIAEELLGAASLSLVARRIIFSEGIIGASIDSEFYTAWFTSPNSAVVPMGNCRAVQDAIAVVSSGKIVTNATAVGIIERDYQPQKYLNFLNGKAEFFVLPTHEVEGLLCLHDVAKAVAVYNGKSEDQFEQLYSEFGDAVRQEFSGENLGRTITERVKQEIRSGMSGFIDIEPDFKDETSLRTTIENGFKETIASVDPSAVFDEQKSLVESKLAGSSQDFLEVLPSKTCLSLLLARLGMTEDDYIKLIVKALNEPDGSGDTSLLKLRDDLVAALTPNLPPR